MARAQELQARAARVEPSVLMNPVLLKPREGHACEVVLMGARDRECSAGEYARRTSRRALEVARRALAELRGRFDLVVIEGAGSPAEVNLRRYDICNMKVARMAGAPVLLVADIDRGGAIASVVGTLAVLRPDEREMVRAVVINKFRGDRALLDPGLRYIERKTGTPVAGVLPWLDCSALDEEDAPSYRGDPSAAVAVVALPHLSCFTDFRPLEALGYRWARRPSDLEGARLVILPGSSSTFSDLDWLRSTGLAAAVTRSRESGTAVMGVCGGYQMLGERLMDPDGVESGGDLPGLGLLPVTTTYSFPRVTGRAGGKLSGFARALPGTGGMKVGGYEIRAGRSAAAGRAFIDLDGGGADGAVSEDGLVFGTGLHGLFEDPRLLEALACYAGTAPGEASPATAERCLDLLAGAIERELDMELLESLAGLR